MKAKYLIVICAAALFAVSCGGGEPVIPQEPEVPEVPEKVKEPVIEGPLRTELDFNSKYGGSITLGCYDTLYHDYLPLTKLEVEIVGGSGGYKIIYPEEIFCKYWGDESEPMVPYSEEILKVWVEGDVIHVERVIPAYDPNGSGKKIYIRAPFILEDGKGQQKPFTVVSEILF